MVTIGFLTSAAVALAASSNAAVECTYALQDHNIPPTLRDFTAFGDRSWIAVATQPGCPWTIPRSAEAWLTVGAAGEPRSGSGDVYYAAARNLSPLRRTTSLVIAGDVLEITQHERPSSLDFDGDGRPDLLWYHEGDGRIAVWRMAGIQQLEGIPTVPAQVTDLDWRLAGGGDLDGDGKPDLVWQHRLDGRISAWLMDGLRRRTGEVFAQVLDTNWQIRAVSDVNGDGRADLLWQHTTDGQVAIWLMAGLRAIDARLVDAPRITDPNWRLVGAGEIVGYGGDSYELLWQHDGDGRLAVWHMRGLDLSGAQVIDQVADTNWKIRAVGDFNNDGAPDLIWQNRADGRLSVWLKYGGRPDLGTVADLQWRIVGSQ